MAPELFEKKLYDEKIDVFAFGTIIWEILIRKIPFDGNEVSEIKRRVLSDEKLYTPKSVSSNFVELINSCRAYDPIKRPSFSEIIKQLDIYN
jgi:serine/threonine protein kinase